MRLSYFRKDAQCRMQDLRSWRGLNPALRITRPEAGLTLVEIALVLVILGILITFGASFIGPLTKKLKYNETKTTIQAAIDGIIGWSHSGKMLPRETSSGANVVDGFDKIPRNTNDAWNKPLVYLYDQNLSYITSPAPPPYLSVGGGICGRLTTGMTVTTSAPATINNVALLVLSGADDYAINTTLNGTLNGAAINSAITASGYATGTIAVSDDDIVFWVTLDELWTKAGCKSHINILNNELPSGAQCRPYLAAVQAEGGVVFSSGGDYRWCSSGTWPSGIPNPTSGCTAPASCSALANDEASWTQATNLNISGTPTTSGAFSVTLFVRDNNDNNPLQATDNCKQENFVLSIAPRSFITITNAYTSANSYKLNSGSCVLFNIGDSVTISTTDSITIWKQTNCPGNSAECEGLRFSDLVPYDTSGDCSIKLTGISNYGCSFLDVVTPTTLPTSSTTTIYSTTTTTTTTTTTVPATTTTTLAGDNCRRTGMLLKNNNRGTLSYQPYYGNCQVYDSEKTIQISEGVLYYNIYNNGACLGTPSCTINYAYIKSFDTNNNCRVMITNITSSSCTFDNQGNP